MGPLPAASVPGSRAGAGGYADPRAGPGPRGSTRCRAGVRVTGLPGAAGGARRCTRTEGSPTPPRLHYLLEPAAACKNGAADSLGFETAKKDSPLLDA